MDFSPLRMSYIVGLGTPNDPRSLKLETRQRRWVHNVVRMEPTRDEMLLREQSVRAICPNARLVSASAVYNCYGLAFAARRSAIVDENDVEHILEDDGYRELPWDPNAWLPGDVVIYRNRTNAIVHAGVIARKEVSLDTGNVDVTVLSAWGEEGEYMHPIDEVAPLLGRPTNVYSQRFLYARE